MSCRKQRIITSDSAADSSEGNTNGNTTGASDYMYPGAIHIDGYRNISHNTDDVRTVTDGSDQVPLRNRGSDTVLQDHSNLVEAELAPTVVEGEAIPMPNPSKEVEFQTRNELYVLSCVILILVVVLAVGATVAIIVLVPQRGNTTSPLVGRL